MSLMTLNERRGASAVGESAKWLHLCNGLDPKRDGGMVPSILGMTGALATMNGGLTIVTPTPSMRGAIELPEGVELVGPVADLERWVRAAEVVHLHGLWQGHTRCGARAARRFGVPYLIAAHGMAEPWALQHKALKKQVYLSLIERRNLRRAACLHALTRPEVGHLRALAPGTPVALVPNGVSLAPFESLPPRDAIEADFPELAGKFVLLFLSRLHVKKGLDLLAEAFGAIANDHPDLHLLIAGHDDGAKAGFESRIDAFGLARRVTFTGHISGESARRAWARADAFTLPSYSEGFSMAILEALAARLPVLITTACHFPELAEIDGGITVTPTLPEVTRGLRELMQRSPSDRAAMAERGRALVVERYTWDHQAARLAEVYHWVARGGTKPDAVLL